MAKPTCVLLDAGPVIGLHAVGAWKQFCDRYEVVVPEIVVEDEALFHSRDKVTGNRTSIDLRRDEAAGLIRVESATLSELLAVNAKFDHVFAEGLHDGELEGLALLAERQDFEKTVFCSGDGAAIQAAVMIGLDERCNALENLLDAMGLRKTVDWPLTSEFHEKHRRSGLDNRISGLGLAREDDRT